MYLKKIVKLKPNKEQAAYLTDQMKDYIKAVNSALDIYIKKGPDTKITTNQIPIGLSSSMKHAAIKDAKRQYGLFKRLDAEDSMRILLNPGVAIHKRIPYVKKPYAKWNKNTCYLNKDSISLPCWKNGHYERICVKYLMPEETYAFLQAHPPVSVEAVWKKNKLLCHFTYFVKEPALKNDYPKENIMGIDLNLKCPAVCVTSDNKVLFAGNGRKNRYIRRHYKAVRETFKQKYRTRDLYGVENKEHHYMNDQDHKISREVINFAIKEQVTEIHLEKLTGSQKNIMPLPKMAREQINSWSYFRLSQYIAYKAKLAGIKVIYVSPVFTSQICPKCQEKTKPIKGGMFHCPVCGYHVHNDLLAAMNIRDRKSIEN